MFSNMFCFFLSFLVSYSVNVSILDVVLEFSCTILSLSLSLSLFFCSISVISTTLSSSLLTCSSVFSYLLLIPSGVFLFQALYSSSLLVLLYTFWLLTASKFSLCSLNLYSSSLNIFAVITLSILMDRSLVSDLILLWAFILLFHLEHIHLSHHFV